MVQINSYNPNRKPTQPSVFRRPRFYLYLIGIFILGYFLVGLGFARHTIVVDNRAPAADQSIWSKLIDLVMRRQGAETDTPHDPNPMPKQESGRFNVLVLGLRGAGEAEDTGRWLTDTMLLVSIDTAAKKTEMISIPRDTYIDMDVPEYQYATDFHIAGKVNEVYVRGLEKKHATELTKIVLSKVTGLYIDKLVIFDFKAFKDIVDSMGGIDVHLDQPFSEKQQWGYEFLLPAGDNHLNGDQALYYVRSRYSTSDFDRARRQQQVVESIKKKAMSLGFLANPVKITSLYSSLKGNLTTDFNIWDTANLLSLGGTLTGKGAIQHYLLTTENIYYETHLPNGEYVLLPRNNTFDTMRDYISAIVHGQPLPTFSSAPSPSPTATPKK